jgi:prepilin-type N-terminal cleavage/methylation domain-containing protein/prepilin-type processing-associated H-X9-DG protein
MKQRAAFSLIELLVVIAIIAILASLVLPILQRALERAHAVKDGSNLHQIGVGTVAYLNDNNDIIFSATTSQQDSAGNTLYAPGLLQIQYVPNPKVFHSDFDRRADKPVSPAIMSYGVNANMINRPAPPSNPSDFDGSWAKLSAASQLIFVAPNIDVGSASTVAFLPQDASAPTVLAIPAPANTRADYRGTHNNRGQITVLYADGHVASIPYQVYSNSSSTDDDKRRWKPIYP